MFYFHATSLVPAFKVHVHVVHPSIIWSRKRGGDSFDVISHAVAAAASACLAYRRRVNETRSSADADNGLDAFVGQSRSTNISGPFQVK